jgi:hypothetical protein
MNKSIVLQLLSCSDHSRVLHIVNTMTIIEDDLIVSLFVAQQHLQVKTIVTSVQLLNAVLAEGRAVPRSCLVTVSVY